MKKLTILLVMLSSAILLTGCGDKKADYQKTLEEYAKNYYDTYLKGYVVGVDAHRVDIAALKTANEDAGGNYDLTKLKDCKDDTTVIINVDEDGNITGYDYELNCK